METKNKIYLPDGHLQTEEIIHDLQGIRTINNDLIVEKSLRSVIGKSYSLIEYLNLNPKIPWNQIEQKIITACKEDPDMHGIFINLFFMNRSQNTDYGKMGELIVKITKS